MIIDGRRATFEVRITVLNLEETNETAQNLIKLKSISGLLPTKCLLYRFIDGLLLSWGGRCPVPLTDLYLTERSSCVLSFGADLLHYAWELLYRVVSNKILIILIIQRQFVAFQEKTSFLAHLQKNALRLAYYLLIIYCLSQRNSIIYCHFKSNATSLFPPIISN